MLTPRLSSEARHGSLGTLCFGSVFGRRKFVEVLLIGVECFLFVFHSLVDLAETQVGERVMRIHSCPKQLSGKCGHIAGLDSSDANSPWQPTFRQISVVFPHLCPDREPL